jgi:hypothetical protein
MRFEQPAAGGARVLHVDWWLLVLLTIVALTAWLFDDIGFLLWAAPALFAAPLTALAAAALILLPGLALLRLIWPTDLVPAERWPLALGVSCALLPLLLLLGEPLALRWNAWLCWGFLAICMVVLAWPRRGEGWRAAWGRRAAWRLDRPHLLLIAITLIAVAVRLYPARDLPAGMLGDSYHHTVIAQLLADHGGLFSSWQPYAPLKTFTYHFGFHAGVAWLHWLSGVPTTRGVLILGQLQSALAIPMVYLLARRTVGGERAGLWAALIAGFVSAMPAYYLNWGRYTQLAGQTILPAACVIWMTLLDMSAARPARRDSLVRLGALAALVTAGLILTHYRIAVFAACFVLVYALYLLLVRLGGRFNRVDPEGRRTKDEEQRIHPALFVLARMAGIGLAAGGAALLIVAPWLLRLREGRLLRIGNNFISSNIGADGANSLPPSEIIFSLFAKSYLVGLALIGVLLLVWRGRWRGLTLVGWSALVWLSANPYLIGLNGAGLITSFAVLIASYLVLAPLAAAAIDIGCEWATRSPPAAQLLTRAQLLVGALVVLWSASWQQRIAAPMFEIFTPADQQAMDWIRRATPPDTAFFVNSFTAYGGSLYVGSDGGWWLPFMSGRRSSLPPITYGSEAGEQPDYARAVNATNAAIQRDPVDTPATIAALRAAGYAYLYDGPTAVGLPPGQTEYIDPDALARSPLYELVYQQGGVTIWRAR